MKVYFSGAHSVGKSTLARCTSQKYKLPMIPETARMILSENEQNINTLRYDLDVADKYQRQVFERQLLEEQKYTSFVSDRSALDVLAYSAQHSRILPKLLASPELTGYIASLKLPDTILFFVRPSERLLVSDGVRETPNLDGVLAIDSMIKFVLSMFEIRFFQIDTDNMQERASVIDNVLSMVII